MSAAGNWANTYPSGSMWIICFPSIKDEFWRMEAGLTLLSETASSLSYTIFVNARNQDVTGIYRFVSMYFLVV